ncbi:hypothetical protein KJ865_00535, partial [Myxococcota bacterium]|nr:hypothetical protein [Myxococcota bacterium]
ADEKYYCQDKPCKQNFLINKQAAVKLGELGIANQDTNYTLVTCLYSVEIGIGNRRKSFRECKVALSKLYKPSLKGSKIDPVGILSLLADGDPARYPLSYHSKKDKWYAYKDGDNFVMYGSDKNQNASRSKTVKDCIDNYNKFRQSDYFKFVTRRRWLALKKFRGSDAKTEKFDDLFENFVKAHKARTDKWGEGACKIFVLNSKGGWDKKDSAVVERTALEALRGMGAGPEIRRIFLDTYSSYAMEAYWDFTAKQSLKAAYVRCKKENMIPSEIPKHCVPKNNNSVAGIKSQWNKLLDYNWLVDSSKEAMFGAGWLTTDMKLETSRRIKAELLHRVRWLHDPRSTVFAAKALAMLPFDKKVYNELMQVVIAKLGEKAKKDEPQAEAWHIASELLWEQFRQQAVQLIQTGKDGDFCKSISEDKLRTECQAMFKVRFEKTMEIFGQWSFNKDRWLHSRYIWISTIQDYFGYWPIDPKTKKPKQMEPKERFLAYKKSYNKCLDDLKAWKKANPRADASKEPICDGYDVTKNYGWRIRRSQSAKDMRKAHIEAKEAEKRLVLAGYERIRLDILESAFDYADVTTMEELLKIKPEDIMNDPGPHPLDKVKRDKLDEAAKIDYELMVQRPWDEKMENDRVARAKKIIKVELDKMKKPLLELKGFLQKYTSRTGEVDLNNVSTLREIVKTVSINKKCPDKDSKGKVPRCAVFENVYDEKTNDWTKVRKPSMQTIITPWKARRKALMLLNGWDKEINPMDRKELVKVLAETYEHSEVPVRQAILLVLDCWTRGEDYEAVSKPILAVINQETKNHRRGGFFWMNQDALAFLGRLKGKTGNGK